MVQAEALLVVLGEQGAKGSPNTLWRRLLYREQKYWEQLSSSIAAFLIDPEQPGRDLKALVGLATLTGAQSAEEGQRVLQALSWLQGLDRRVYHSIDRWLHQLYPGREHWQPLKPDRLADVLLAELLDQGREFTEALPELALQGSREQLAHSLSVLSRMSLQYPENAHFALDQLLAAAPQTLLSIAIATAPQAGKPLGKGIERLLQREPLELTQAEELLKLLPQASTALADVAVLLTQQVLAGVKASGNDETSRGKQAWLLNTLSLRLSAVGDRPGALTAIQDAVAIYQDLAAVAPDTFRPTLAMSLNNLSRCLSAVGDHPGALAASQNAVAIRRDLAAVAPDTFRRALASSLNNLSICLSAVGNRPEALAAIQDAVAIYQGLAAVAPDAFRSALAKSLNNLSLCLSAVGNQPGALAAIQDAVAIYQGLAAVAPDAFRPALASSLNNLSICLSAVGNRPEALTAIQDAVTIRRGLAAVAPDAFRPDLAQSLHHLSSSLSDVEQLDEALIVGREAVEHYRTLASQSPRFFRSYLANSLDTVARCLSQLNQIGQALETIQEAMELGVVLLLENSQVDAELVEIIRTLYLNLCEENHITPNPKLLAGTLSN
jgi:tetratricopeptide (TPR) repeat protein